jgi:hypothetical protein
MFYMIDQIKFNILKDTYSRRRYTYYTELYM